MPEDKTFDDVIEAQRTHLKAERFHVTLGPEATPESLERAFAKINAETARWASFTELEREQAKVARLTAALGRIASRCARPLLAERKELEDRLNDIFGEADMVADVDLVEDVAWMEENRRKQRLELPEMSS